MDSDMRAVRPHTVLSVIADFPENSLAAYGRMLTAMVSLSLRFRSIESVNLGGLMHRTEGCPW